MSSNIPFIFKSAPSFSSYTNPAMPCYDCSMLGYSTTCTSCSPFIAGTPATTPSSPAVQATFNIDFSTPLATVFPVAESPFTPRYSITVIEEPRARWTALEAAEPSTKTTRFNWSEMDFPNCQNNSDNFSECPFCSMVPYGALCTSCNQIQTSKTTTPPTAWSIINPLGNQQGTKAPEEQLLQTLDKQLYEQINIPPELDDWGRRIYDDSGNRLLYYEDEDRNTVIGYEAWYPCSVIGDFEDPNDWRANSPLYDAAAEYDASFTPHDVCARRVITDDVDDDMTDISGYEQWYSCPETNDYEQEMPPNYLTIEQYDSDSMVGFEQQRFAEFLGAQDDELPQFSSDRGRIAAWVAGAYVAAGDDDEEDEQEEFVSIRDLEVSDVVSQWSELY